MNERPLPASTPQNAAGTSTPAAPANVAVNRIVAPAGNPDGCCADCCPDPTQPCCGPFGLPASQELTGELPCDGACCWATTFALLLTIGGVLVLTVSMPSLADIGPVDDPYAVQTALCRSVGVPAALSGCARAQDLGAVQKGDIVKPSFVGAPMGLTAGAVVHAPLIAIEMRLVSHYVAVCYLVPACVLWCVIAAATWRYCRAPPAPPVATTRQVTAAAQAPAPTAPMGAQAQLRQFGVPVAPVAPMRPMTLSSDESFKAVMAMWPAAAALLLVAGVVGALPLHQSLALARDAMREGSPAAELLQTFTTRSIASGAVVGVVVGFPLVKAAAMAAMWIAGGVPWLLYRFAGDRRVRHRVMDSNGALLTDPCDAPWCIAVDMVCCGCFDADAPVDDAKADAAPPTAEESPKEEPQPVAPALFVAAAAASAPPTRQHSPAAPDEQDQHMSKPQAAVTKPNADGKKTDDAVKKLQASESQAALLTDNDGQKKKKKAKKDKSEADTAADDAALVAASSATLKRKASSSGKLKRSSSRKSSRAPSPSAHPSVPMHDLDLGAVITSGSFDLGGSDDTAAQRKADKEARRAARAERKALRSQQTSAAASRAASPIEATMAASRVVVNVAGDEEGDTAAPPLEL